MPNYVKVIFEPLDSKSSKSDADRAKQFFQEWAAEGGLAEAFNPALKAELGLNVLLLESGPDWLGYKVHKATPSKTNQQRY